MRHIRSKESTPSQVCVSLAFGRMMAKMTPSLDHLLRLGYKDSQLETAKGCQKVVDLAGRRRFTGFEVALDA
jgi:hypothetical protein